MVGFLIQWLADLFFLGWTEGVGGIIGAGKAMMAEVVGLVASQNAVLGRNIRRSKSRCKNLMCPPEVQPNWVGKTPSTDGRGLEEEGRRASAVASPASSN